MPAIIQKILQLHPSSEDQTVQGIIKKLVSETIKEIGEDRCLDSISQFVELFRKLPSKKKLQPLQDKNHRLFVIQLLKEGEITLYNPSYLNRAKITSQTLKLLKEVGPYLFTEGIVIVSKLNIIHKHFSRRIIEDNLYNDKEDIIDLKISEILKTCTEKKRSVNKNSKKLQLLFQDPYIRVQLVKQLGKLLRDAWKQDKIQKGNKIYVQSDENEKKEEENEDFWRVKQIDSVQEYEEDRSIMNMDDRQFGNVDFFSEILGGYI